MTVNILLTRPSEDDRAFLSQSEWQEIKGDIQSEGGGGEGKGKVCDQTPKPKARLVGQFRKQCVSLKEILAKSSQSYPLDLAAALFYTNQTCSPDMSSER